MKTNVSILKRLIAIIFDCMYPIIIGIAIPILIVPDNEIWQGILMLFVVTSLIVVDQVIIPLLSGYTISRYALGFRIKYDNGNLKIWPLIKRCIVLYTVEPIFILIISIPMMFVRNDKKSIHEIVSNTYYECDECSMLSPLKLIFNAVVIYVVICLLSVIYVKIYKDVMYSLLESVDYSNISRIQDDLYKELDTDSNGFVVYGDRIVKVNNGNIYSWFAFDWNSSLQERNDRIYCNDDGLKYSTKYYNPFYVIYDVRLLNYSIIDIAIPQYLAFVKCETKSIIFGSRHKTKKIDTDVIVIEQIVGNRKILKRKEVMANSAVNPMARSSCRSSAPGGNSA